MISGNIVNTGKLFQLSYLLKSFLLYLVLTFSSPSYTNNGGRNGDKFDFELIVTTYYKHPHKIQRAPGLKLV